MLDHLRGQFAGFVLPPEIEIDPYGRPETGQQRLGVAHLARAFDRHRYVREGALDVIARE